MLPLPLVARDCGHGLREIRVSLPDEFTEVRVDEALELGQVAQCFESRIARQHCSLLPNPTCGRLA